MGFSGMVGGGWGACSNPSHFGFCGVQLRVTGAAVTKKTSAFTSRKRRRWEGALLQTETLSPHDLLKYRARRQGGKKKGENSSPGEETNGAERKRGGSRSLLGTVTRGKTKKNGKREEETERKIQYGFKHTANARPQAPFADDFGVSSQILLCTVPLAVLLFANFRGFPPKKQQQQKKSEKYFTISFNHPQLKPVIYHEKKSAATK